MAADIFGQGIDGNVDAVVKRTLKHRSEQSIVAHDDGALALFGGDLVGDAADSHEIDQRVGRVGRRFDENDRYAAFLQPSSAADANGCLIDTIGETHSADAKIGQGLGKQGFGAAIERLRMHDGVTRTGEG